jgi:hypothetical protein
LRVLRANVGPLRAALTLPGRAIPRFAAWLAAALLCATATGAEVPAAGTDLVASAAGTEAEGIPGVEEVASRHYGPPEEIEGIPSDAVLEREHAVIGQVLVDNQNIFNLDDPKDDKKIFRLANDLHYRTRASVIRGQLLFKPGEPYSRRKVQESERLLRADSYFYDAWIRPVRYQDGKVDLKVTTKDVWTLNPGFNFSRSGGANSTGLKLEDSNLLGTGAGLKVSYSNTIDRSGSAIELSDKNVFNTWTSVAMAYGNFSDGHVRLFNVTRPFYSLDTHNAGSFAILDATQTDPLYDRGKLVDQFQDAHRLVQAYYGWSSGLQNQWVHRWSVGVTTDEHNFSPVTNSNGTTNLLPPDRRFNYPFIEWDLVQDDFLKLWNHDQIGRTEDYQLGTTASVRLGWADTTFGSTSDALMMNAAANRGFRFGLSTLLFATDFSGRLQQGTLHNGLLDGSVRYYVEQSKNWLFFGTVNGTKGWNLDLDDQILLGGDNGLRGYPLRYQAGTARALMSVEQRYFTDWYPFRLFRVGGAIFYDMGRTWGTAPLAQPSLGLLKDAGFGLRFGNARSGLGNVIHVDLAFPLNSGPDISKVQFLVQTEASF